MMDKAKLYRYVGLATALFLLSGFVSTGIKQEPQLTPLDNTVLGYLVAGKDDVRYEHEAFERYLICTMENTGRRSCAREIGWPTLEYLRSLPNIKEQYSNFSNIPLIDTDDFEARAAQEIYFYGHYLQAEELPALKTKILVSHALLFLGFLLILVKREAVGKFLCNSVSLLWATLLRITKSLLGAARGIHERI